MIHPATRLVYVSDVVGWGVVATQTIPRGTIAWTQDALDRVFEPHEVAALSPAAREQLVRYAHVNERGNYVLCWDAGKLINHSCAPTLRGVGTWFQVARRDILPGEELTCDYAECNISDALGCACATDACRGSVAGRDLLRFAEAWDAEARELACELARVEQPLWSHLLDPSWAAALRDGSRPLPSFRDLHAEATVR